MQNINIIDVSNGNCIAMKIKQPVHFVVVFGENT